MEPALAYARIRDWYRANIDKIEVRGDAYAEKAAKFIRALPPVESATPVEMQAVFMHVMTMYLEWGYGETDGFYKMSEYVRMTVGSDFYLSDEQIGELRKSRLWPYLQREDEN